jgi:hypothetical protein
MRIHEILENTAKQFPIPLETTNLDMTKSARMHRASQLGFDTSNIYYHGTEHSFKSFDPHKSNSATNTGTPTGALVLSNNPAVSSTYAGAEPSLSGEITKFKQGGNVMPLLVKPGKSMVIDAKGANWNDIYLKSYPDLETTNDFAIFAQSKGKDTLLIKNVHDNKTWQKGKTPSTVVFVFHPSYVRSINAKFDPANGESEDLMD